MISKWGDIIIAVVTALLLSWGLIQTQEVRITHVENDVSKMDSKLEAHIVIHEEQNQEIMNMMSKIQMDVQVIITKLQMQGK